MIRLPANARAPGSVTRGRFPIPASVRLHFAALAVCACLPLQAQDLTLSGGHVQSQHPEGDGNAWSIRYTHDLAVPLFGGIEYVNEGHVPSHHRDGTALLAGIRNGAPWHDLVFSLAAGPYRYFDTRVAQSPDGFHDAHGWAGLYTVSAAWAPASSRWFVDLRLARVESAHGPDTTMILAGLGMKLDQDETFGPRQPPRDKGGRDAITVYAGQTIVNDFESPTAFARSVEYRHAFTPVVRGSAAWINEGDARLIRRNGIAAQAWLEPTFDGGRFSMGLGFGPYIAVDDYRPGGRYTIGLLSWTLSHRITRSWDARFTWHRSVSDNDRDSDIILLGVGYQF